MSRIIGRADDMLIIRGVNVFPSQIEEALTGIENITPHHQIIVTRENRLDALEVQVEVSEDFFRHVGQDIFAGHAEEGVAELRELEGTIQQKIYNILGINTKVTVLPPFAAPRSEGGKLRRLVDRREL
jgi:phenylacetate-CoA ligase